MKLKPLFIGIAAMFSATAFAGGQASQGASQPHDVNAQGAQQQQAGADAQKQASADKETVKQAQEKLSQKGHDVQADGILGPQTQAALKEFQQSNGLQASGQLDQQTLAALEIDASASVGSSSEQKKSD